MFNYLKMNNDPKFTLFESNIFSTRPNMSSYNMSLSNEYFHILHWKYNKKFYFSCLTITAIFSNESILQIELRTNNHAKF